MDDLDLDQITGAMGDMSSFDRKLKAQKQLGTQQPDSSDSDEDNKVGRINRNDPMAILEEKN